MAGRGRYRRNGNWCAATEMRGDVAVWKTLRPSCRPFGPMYVLCAAAEASSVRGMGANQTQQRARQRMAAASICGAAATYALTPSIIHLTADHGDPFVFNAVQLAVQVLFLALALAASAPDCLRTIRASHSRSVDISVVGMLGLRQSSTYLAHFRKDPPVGKNRRAVIATASLRDPVSWAQTPMGWMFFGGFAFATYSLAARYAETVAAATAFELWPLWFVYGHAWLVSRERQYLASSGSPATPDAVLGSGRAAAAVLAVPAVVLVLASQSTAPLQRVGSLLSWESVLGTGLGLLAGVQAAAAAIGGLAFGLMAYYRSTDERMPAVDRSSLTAERRTAPDLKLLLWATLWGSLAGRVAGLPANLAAAAVSADLHIDITARGVGGAAVLGLLVAVSTVLLRAGNVAAAAPDLNALFFLSPVLGLGLLFWLGAALPRPGLLIAGAALIVALNVWMQTTRPSRR